MMMATRVNGGGGGGIVRSESGVSSNVLDFGFNDSDDDDPEPNQDYVLSSIFTSPHHRSASANKSSHSRLPPPSSTAAGSSSLVKAQSSTDSNALIPYIHSDNNRLRFLFYFQTIELLETDLK